MTEYILVGGGSLAREILDWFSPSVLEAGSRFVGYLDDTGETMASYGSRLPWLGPVDSFRPELDKLLVMAVAAPRGKAALAERLLSLGGRFATLVHPRGWVSASAVLGQGVVVGPFTDVSADAVLEDFVMLNGFASAGHDVTVGRCSTLSGYVDLMGHVRVGAQCLFGSGSRVLPRLTIGEGCTIGAGAVVVRSAPAGVTLYAAPARRL